MRPLLRGATSDWGPQRSAGYATRCPLGLPHGRPLGPILAGWGLLGRGLLKAGRVVLIVGVAREALRGRGAGVDRQHLVRRQRAMQLRSQHRAWGA